MVIKSKMGDADCMISEENIGDGIRIFPLLLFCTR